MNIERLRKKIEKINARQRAALAAVEKYNATAARFAAELETTQPAEDEHALRHWKTNPPQQLDTTTRTT